MQSKLSDKDRLMGGSQKHQSSVTFADFSERDGANFIKEWISSRLDGRVRTSQSQDTAQGSRARSQDCGRKRLNVSGYLDPDGVSWRTPQQSFLDEGLTEYVGTWPRSAIMCGGMLSAVPSRAHRISGNDGGLWPTPRTQMTRPVQVRKDGYHSNLEEAVAVRWPTPTSTEHKGWSPGHNRADTDDRLDYTVEREGDYENSKARLNPTFVEWLMNVPEGWSSLDPVSAEDYNDWFNQTMAGTFWNVEKGPRVDVNIPQRAKRLILLGNGIVPRTLALFLRDRIRDSELNSSDV